MVLISLPILQCHHLDKEQLLAVPGILHVPLIQTLELKSGVLIPWHGKHVLF